MGLLHRSRMRVAMIEFGFVPVSIRETTGYVTDGFFPTVILISYILSENSATSLQDFFRFRFSTYRKPERTIRPFLFNLNFNKS